MGITSNFSAPEGPVLEGTTVYRDWTCPGGQQVLPYRYSGTVCMFYQEVASKVTSGPEAQKPTPSVS